MTDQPSKGASQKERILRFLEAGERLDQETAMREFQCRRLAARIWDLRQAGHPIGRTMAPLPEGGLEAVYYLSAPPL